MKDLGLVFRDAEDEIWCGVFDEGIISTFTNITDDKMAYSELAPHEFAVVEVTDDDDIGIDLNKIKVIQIVKSDGYVPVTSFIQEVDALGDEEYESTWAGLYINLVKHDSPQLLH